MNPHTLRMMQSIDAYLPAVLAALWLVLLVRHRRTLWNAARPASAATWGVILALCAAGWAVRMHLAPHVPYTFDDEFFHTDIVKNLLRDQRFAFSVSDCHRPGVSYQLPQWMPVFHGALVLWSFAAGVGAGAASLFNVCTGTLTIAACFAFGRMFFRRDRPALALSAMVAAHPLHIKFCGAGNTEPLSVLLIAMTLAVAVWRYRITPDGIAARTDDSGSVSFGALAIVTGALAAMTRIENALLLAPILVLEAAPAIRAQGAGFWDRMLLPALATMTGILVVAQAYVSYACHGYWRAAVTGWPVLSPVAFLFVNPLWPAAITILAAVGIARWWKSNRALAIAAIGAIAAYYAVYTTIHRLDVNMADFHRYNIQVMLLLLVPATAAFDGLCAEAAGRVRAGAWAVAVLWVAGLTLSVPAIRMHYWPARTEEWRWLRKQAPSLPPGAVVATEAPFLVRSTAGARVLHAAIFLDDPGCRPRQLTYFYLSLAERRQPELDALSRLARMSRLTPFRTTRIAGETVGFFLLDEIP